MLNIDNNSDGKKTMLEILARRSSTHVILAPASHVVEVAPILETVPVPVVSSPATQKERMFRLPTTTVLHARLNLFQATQRPKFISGEWTQSPEGKYGRARVTGRLGQKHADLVECMRSCTGRLFMDKEGRAVGVVDLYKVRLMLGSGGELFSYEQTWKLVEELRASSITIQTEKTKVLGGIIDFLTEAEDLVHDPLHPGKRRPLWEVTWGITATELFNCDIPLHYHPKAIISLKNGISQALARLVLGHRSTPNGGWKLDGLINSVAGKVLTGTALRNARRAVRDDAAGLLEAGVMVAGDRVHAS